MAKSLGEYAFTVHLDVPYETALERTEAALKEQGFGIVSELDMRKIFKAKLDREFRRYAILGACNPTLAIEALGADPQVGLLLPCNVIVYENDEGGSTVSIVNPLSLLQMAEDADLSAVAREAHERLRQVADALS
jgi:uncharacterized protein (DUF302 family)